MYSTTTTTTSSSSPTNSASSNMKEVELRCSNIKVLSGLHFAGASAGAGGGSSYLFRTKFSSYY